MVVARMESSFDDVDHKDAKKDKEDKQNQHELQESRSCPVHSFKCDLEPIISGYQPEGLDNSQQTEEFDDFKLLTAYIGDQRGDTDKQVQDIPPVEHIAAWPTEQKPLGYDLDDSFHREDGGQSDVYVS
jgi:hypothetical protein